jgi:ElaB/YqjD/DUF883 family membrane-anchored ribosome-binding protein
MTSFSKIRNDLTGDLESQVERLQKEVNSLRKVLNKRGGQAYDRASDVAGDLYDDVAGRIADAMPHIRKQSKVVRRAASDNPVAAAVVGLVVVGLLVGLFSRR